jgi:hypothetical protein
MHGDPRPGFAVKPPSNGGSGLRVERRRGGALRRSKLPETKSDRAALPLFAPLRGVPAGFALAAASS